MKEMKNKNNAFTLAEVLITLGIIGVVAMMLIPTLVDNIQHQEWVTGVLKEYSVLNQAILSWKNDVGCTNSAYDCILAQGVQQDDCSSFNPISKFLKLSDVTDASSGTSTTSVGWLPATSYSYTKTQETGWGGLANDDLGCKYQLQDGTLLKVDPDPDGFNLHIDVNGIKPPNRVGKDIYCFFIGKMTGNDIHADMYVKDEAGLCSYGSGCIPGNIDPSKNGGATPTSYVLLYKKIPNFYN